MSDLNDFPYDILSSQIIPDSAFVDVDGVVIKIPMMINMLETGREKRNDYDGDKGERMDEEREKAERQIVDGRWSRWPTIFKEGQEEEIAGALNAIAQEISDRCKIPLKRRYTADYCHGKTYGDRNRRPDLVVISIPTQSTRERDKQPSKSENSRESNKQNSEGESATAVRAATNESRVDEGTPNPITKVEWRTFLAFGEVKSYSNPSQSEIVSGLDKYIYDIFAVQDDRNWAIACAFVEADLFVYLYDRSGVVRTKRINIHERKEDFLRVAIGVLFVDDKYLGRDPTIKMKDGKRYITVKQSDDTHTELEIVKTIFRSRSIQGRGTTVWYVVGHLKYENDKEGSRRRGFIVKDSWVDESNKTKEHVILEKLRGFRNTPYMCTHEDMGGRTKYFRQGAAIEKSSKIVSREHHRVVLDTVGRSISDFKSSDELIISFANIFLAIIDLKTVKNILHRDISVNNLVLIDIGDYLRDGCLIDFDYSVDLSDLNTSESLTKRSGTIPFMAIEVLYNLAGFEHKYYHDIESAFYVLIWICLERSREWFQRQEKDNPKKFKTPSYAILDDWNPKHIEPEKLYKLALLKRSCIIDPAVFKLQVLDLLSPEFELVKWYLEKLRHFITQSGAGVSAPNRHPMVDREEICNIHEEAFLKLVPVPQGGSKRKRHPSGGPGNLLYPESKKQKGSYKT